MALCGAILALASCDRNDTDIIPVSVDGMCRVTVTVQVGDETAAVFTYNLTDVPAGR